MAELKCPKCKHTWTVKKGKKSQYLGFVFLTDDEYKKLIEKFGKSGTQVKIKSLDDALAIHGYKYNSHYRVILKWAENEPVKPAINEPIPKPVRIRRKDTPEEESIIIKMRALTKGINWRNRAEVDKMSTEMRKLQKKYDDLRKDPQKVGDILRTK